LNVDNNLRGQTLMEPEYDPARLGETSSGAPIPFWVWLLVVALGAISVYAAYAALSEHQLYLQGESVRVDLAQERDRLKANVADLGRQVEQANRSRSDVENALKQSRANTESASAQIGDLQGQVGQMRQKTGDLEHARDAAASAKEALEREVTTLKGQLAQAQKKLNAALADLTKERQQISPAPVPPPAPPGP
jgi:FtsZ-binding cell division protein ZapB